MVMVVFEPIPSDSGRYRFGHALIQQAVYEEIPPMRRAQVHRTAGEMLEQKHKNNLDEHAAELAHHFEKAGAVSGVEKIVRYSLIAGERAQAGYVDEGALAYFHRGLAVSDGHQMDTDDAGLFFGLGRAQAALQKGEAFSNQRRVPGMADSLGYGKINARVLETPSTGIGRSPVDGDVVLENP